MKAFGRMCDFRKTNENENVNEKREVVGYCPWKKLCGYPSLVFQRCCCRSRPCWPFYVCTFFQTLAFVCHPFVADDNIKWQLSRYEFLTSYLGKYNNAVRKRKCPEAFDLTSSFTPSFSAYLTARRK